MNYNDNNKYDFTENTRKQNSLLTLTSPQIKQIIDEFEYSQKKSLIKSLNKISPPTQFIKDEFQAILKAAKKKFYWETFCFNSEQFNCLSTLCNVANIPFSYAYVYSEREPDVLDYIIMYSKKMKGGVSNE